MKELEIKADKKLRDVQLEFNEHYPYLRIEFFANRHGMSTPSPSTEKLDADLTIGQIWKAATEGHVSLKGSQKVGDFEQDFAKNFGLHVQVLRKSYGKWLQTWATDIWTLEEQNGRGKLIGNKPR